MPASLRDKVKTKHAVLKIIEDKCKGAFLGPKWRGKVTMTFWASWTHKNGKLKRRDAHNYAMVLIDLLEKPLGFDDSQILTFIIRKREARSREHVITTFS